MMEPKRYNFIVVGGGLAGLYAAHCAAKYGRVALLTQETFGVSNSFWAQGGMAASVGEDDERKAIASHVEDTLRTGRGLCRPEAVEILGREGRERALDLIALGMPFDREGERLDLGLEGGHSMRRILHAGGDATGREMVKFLWTLVVQNPHIDIREHMQAVSLTANNEHCYGVVTYNHAQRHTEVFAGHVILATGGAAALYERSTNPSGAVGEGIAMAYDAGAALESMEFIQFHPTSFYSGSSETFLLSEAMRGEGAYIVNKQNRRFVLDGNPHGELAPRDVVAQLIDNELRRTGETQVYLDLRHLDAARIKKRFTTIYEKALTYQIDITTDLIPIAPASHYLIGGVKTDVHGESSLKGLFCVGEMSSTGVHGANRLASNSLLECLVFAQRAAARCAKLPALTEDAVFPTEFSFCVNEKNRAPYLEIKKEIGQILTRYVGIVRTEETLQQALHMLRQLKTKFSSQPEYYAEATRKMLLIATCITEAARHRKESRGCHYRADFPQQRDPATLFVQQRKDADNA